MQPLLLAVDDAKAVRTLVKQALAPYACHVQEATNGYNALFAMEQALPDLVLLDVSMPVMDGLELLEMMRANATLRPIPVLMLTSRTDHLVLPRITALGVSGLLVKPVSPDGLVNTIREILPLRQRT